MGHTMKRCSVMKRRLLVALVALAASVGGATAAPAPSAAVPASLARICSAGYRHAIIGGAEKCLRAGEFCTHSLDYQYRRYGFRCIKFYANVGRYRLTHA